MANDADALFKAHGIIMVTVVMVLMTTGMLLSRYLKTFFNKWFYVHVTVTLLAVVGMIVAVILAFRGNDNYFYQSSHTVLGLIFVSSMGLQTILGFASHFLFNPKRSHPPILPDQAHWWLGRFAFIVGGLTVTLGMLDIGARQMSIISFYLWGITIFVTILYLERYVGQTHETATQGPADGAFMLVDDDASGNIKGKHHHHHDDHHHHHNVVIRAPMVVIKIVGCAALIVLVLYVVVAIGISQAP